MFIMNIRYIVFEVKVLGARACLRAGFSKIRSGTKVPYGSSTNDVIQFWTKKIDGDGAGSHINSI